MSDMPLSLSYQKEDWRAGPRQSSFWYLTDFTILSLKAADYKSIVSVLPEGGLAGPLPLVYDIFKDVFLQHTTQILKKL